MNTSLFDLFQRGGPVMWFILVCSVTALAIALERLFILSKAEEEISTLLTQLTAALRQHHTAQAEKLCRTARGPLARMAQATFERRGRPRAEIMEKLEEIGSLEIPSLERRIPILGTVAQLAPLLGLLGTVTGLIRCFQVIQEKATTVNPVNPGDLAGGIWEALLTTVFGLIVAIPSYALYNYLADRVNNLSSLLEGCAVELADLLSEEGRSGS